jgi:hypothetical protein
VPNGYLAKDCAVSGRGLIPPVVAAPAFAIRKPAVAIFTLRDYASTGIMTDEQAEIVRFAVRERRNVLVAGGASTGKTTMPRTCCGRLRDLFDDRLPSIQTLRRNRRAERKYDADLAQRWRRAASLAHAIGLAVTLWPLFVFLDGICRNQDLRVCRS